MSQTCQWLASLLSVYCAWLHFSCHVRLHRFLALEHCCLPSIILWYAAFAFMLPSHVQSGSSRVQVENRGCFGFVDPFVLAVFFLEGVGGCSWFVDWSRCSPHVVRSPFGCAYNVCTAYYYAAGLHCTIGGVFDLHRVFGGVCSSAFTMYQSCWCFPTRSRVFQSQCEPHIAHCYFINGLKYCFQTARFIYLFECNQQTIRPNFLNLVASTQLVFVSPSHLCCVDTQVDCDICFQVPHTYSVLDKSFA